jgi:hypothetical protein
MDEKNKGKRPDGWKPSKNEKENMIEESTTVVDTMWTMRIADSEDYSLPVEKTQTK